MKTIDRHFGVLLAGLLAVACGGDEEPPPKPKKAEPGDGAAAKPAAAPAAAPARGKKRRAAKGGTLVVYPRIDEKYRRPLSEADFVPDGSGDERRDPFQSFVVRQGRGSLAATQVQIQPTDVCTEKNTKAPGFLLRDMRLIGIVLRGTNSFAQFRDRTGFGWIVSRGDCLGKEKAVVQAVGVGSVTLEVIPETPPNAPPPAPQRQDIALYPDDLDPGLAIGTPEAPPTLEPAPSSAPSGVGSPPPSAIPPQPAAPQPAAPLPAPTQPAPPPR